MTTRERTATAGRQRSCDQCGTTYQPARANSRYCSTRCIKRAQRAAKPTPRRIARGLRRWLAKRDFIGAVSNGGCAVNVPLQVVLDELKAAAAEARSQGLQWIAPSTKADLKAALRDMRIAA